MKDTEIVDVSGCNTKNNMLIMLRFLNLGWFSREDLVVNEQHLLMKYQDRVFQSNNDVMITGHLEGLKDDVKSGSIYISFLFMTTAKLV